jgi:ligand-binding sensor domain-containing protein/DNA-binding CsgD family transcriptional regulator
MKYTVVFSILLLLGLDLNAQELGLPISKFYSSKEYNGGIQNFAITQSESGLIYVANNFGLLEYDGTTWSRYSLPNSTKIRDVSIDQKGIIYVAGQGEFGYFKPTEQGFLKYHSLLDSLPDIYKNLEEIWKIFLIHDQIVFCTFQEIFTFSNEQKLLSVTENKPSFESFHLSNNRIFGNQLEKGIQIFGNKSFEIQENGQFFKDKLVTGIISQANNQHLVFTRDDGIYTFGSAGVMAWKNDTPSSATINEAIRLKNGNLALGTQSSGLFILNDSGNIILHMDKENGLQNNSIISLFEDISGNLWIGHNNGITLLELSLPFRIIDKFAGLPGTGYNASFFDGAIYYGTNNGLSYQRFEQEKPLPIEPVPGSSGQVYKISQIQNHLLMAHNDGAFTIKENRAIPAGGYGGIWNFQPLNGSPNHVIAGSYDGLQLYGFNRDKLNYLRKFKGFDESSRILEQDADGTIWMTHGYKGVYRLKPNPELDSLEVKYYGTENGLPTSLLISVWKINDRLIFSTQYGIYTYNTQEDRFEKDQIFAKYFDYDFLATSMVEDPLGNIFFIGAKEVGVLEKQINGSYVKNHQIFNKIIPFLNDDLQNISLIRSNEVLFAANDGFIWYKLENKSPSTPSFPTIIRAVYLTGLSDSLVFRGNYRPFKLSTKEDSISYLPEFQYGLANIRFEFSNPIPNNENSTQFQFWLEGLEKEFGEWTYKRDKAYTNLREGIYTFHVRSKNIYGQISDINTFTFKVAPPWYRSTLAYLIYFVLLIGATFIIYTIVEKRYHKKTIKITDSQRKALIQKETALKSSQEELEKLRNEKLESEIQAKDKELASATMHLINKNGFIDQTKTHLNSIIKKSKNPEVKSEIEKVVQSIDKNIAGDKDWEQFEIHFDQVHGDFMSRFKKQYPSLSPQEIKLSAYLRMNLSSKEIAYLMNISTRGIEIARYRLRKKMHLERTANLQEFILKF